MEQDGNKRKPGPAKGSQYKKTAEIRLDLINTLRAKGFDPAAALIEVHMEAMIQYRKRIDPINGKPFGAVGFLEIAKNSASDLMEFIYPKLKSMELTGQDGKDFFQSFTQLMRDIATGEVKHEQKISGSSPQVDSSRS